MWLWKSEDLEQRCKFRNSQLIDGKRWAHLASMGRLTRFQAWKGEERTEIRVQLPSSILALKQIFHSLPLQPLCISPNTAPSASSSLLLLLLGVARLFTIFSLSLPDILPMLCLPLTVHSCSHLLSNCPVPGTVLSPDHPAVTKTKALPQNIYILVKEKTLGNN